jgi:ferric-dicitrate binding protein FerR (iron transport regulator)
LKERIRRLQAVHDKFRGVVAEGETMPSTWSEAKPEHRRAFENFFSGWKPLPPSMSQLQRRAPARAAGDCGYRSTRRTANARAEAALQVRCSTSRCVVSLNVNASARAQFNQTFILPGNSLLLFLFNSGWWCSTTFNAG